jgi:aspartate/methionine/tyrosine aminotransferase
MRESSRRITPFYVMEILERAQKMEEEGRDIVHMEVGEPDFPTPTCISNAALSALRDGKTRYTHSQGIIELRETIAEIYAERYNVKVSPDQIVVTSGSSPAMLLAFTALLNHGDVALLSDPHYACYPNFLYHLEVEPRFLPVRPETAFQLDPGEVAKSLDKKVRAILINSPANPTGTVMDTETMASIAKLGPTIVSDEIYHGLVYGSAESHSILEYTDNAVVISGFSKLYAMTGWRLGYAIVPPKLVRPIQILQQNFFISPNAFVQWAGIAALREARTDVAKMVEELGRRRETVLDGLKRIGLNVPVEPKGAFYVWVDVCKFTADTLAFAYRILDEAGVAVAPGIDFGQNGEGYLRLSYATSIEKVNEGISRLGNFFKSL